MTVHVEPCKFSLERLRLFSSQKSSRELLHHLFSAILMIKIMNSSSVQGLVSRNALFDRETVY